VKIGNDAGMTQIKAVAQNHCRIQAGSLCYFAPGPQFGMACFLLLHNFIYAFAFTVVEDSADPLEHKQAGIAWQRRHLQE
jgi:hypothetical protein